MHRPRTVQRALAGLVAVLVAVSAGPLIGSADAADPLPPVANPIGEGAFCEDAPETNPFTDVTAADPGRAEILCLVATGLTTGTTPSTYAPNGQVTRRQMALFIKRLVDLANELELVDLQALPASDGSSGFSDVGAGDPGLEAVSQLRQAGIVGGFADGTYRPNDPVTRRQMAAFVNRAQEFLAGDAFEAPDGADYFDDDDGDPGEANLNALASVGIFQGDGAGNVAPGANITRRQMAFVLLRHLQVNFADGAIDRAFEPPPAPIPQDTGVVVQVNLGADTYRFVADSDDQIIDVTYDTAADSFEVDGVAATAAGFEANITVGDRITVTENEDGTLTHSLVNQDPPDEGTIGDIYTPNMGGFARTYRVIEPVTGVALSGFISYDTTCDLYQVDGAPTTLAGFESHLNEGDVLARTEAGGIETCSLTNQTVAGTVEAVQKSAHPSALFRIGNLGDSWDDSNAATGPLASADLRFIVDPGYAPNQSFSVDGAAATLAQFVAALSNGDQATYTRVAGVETFTLVNSAPTTVSGLAQEDLGAGGGDLSAETFVIATSTGSQLIDYSATTRFFVDGLLATQAEFEDAYTAGDAVSFTPGDAPTSTVETVSLNNQTLTGTLADINTAADRYDVVAPNGTTRLANDLDYTTTYFGGPNDRYFVNGDEVTQVAFETELNAISGGTREGTIEVRGPDNSGTLATEHRITSQVASP